MTGTSPAYNLLAAYNALMNDDPVTAIAHLRVFVPAPARSSTMCDDERAAYVAERWEAEAALGFFGQKGAPPVWSRL